jgi:hypothetical protein
VIGVKLEDNIPIITATGPAAGANLEARDTGRVRAGAVEDNFESVCRRKC